MIPVGTVTFAYVRPVMHWCPVHGRALVPAGWDCGQGCRMPAAWMPFPAGRLAYALRWVRWAGSAVQVDETPCDVCTSAATQEVA